MRSKDVREDEGRSPEVIAPAELAESEEDAAPVGEGVWGESRLVLPEGRYTDVMAGRAVGGGPQRMADLLDEFPVALLVPT